MKEKGEIQFREVMDLLGLGEVVDVLRQSPHKPSLQLVNIAGDRVERMEYKGRPIVTLEQVDVLHRRPSGQARHAFNRHKDKLVPGIDYVEVPYKEWANLLSGKNLHVRKDTREKPARGDGGGRKGPMIFLYLPGYLMVVKSFHDDRAWQVQRDLVTAYFAYNLGIQQPPAQQALSAVTLQTVRRETATSLLSVQTRLSRTGKDMAWVERLIKYRRIGLLQTETGKLLDCSEDTVRRYEKLLKTSGLWDILAPKAVKSRAIAELPLFQNAGGAK